MQNKKTLFATIMGLPNAGKSTLLNKIIGRDISIVTKKAQTTRNLLHGIYTQDDTQIIFVDTPGVFSANKEFEKKISGAAFKEAKENDAVIFILDAFEFCKKYQITDELKFIFEKIKSYDMPKILVLNKIDKLDRKNLLQAIDVLKDEILFDETFLISAKKSDGIKDLLNLLKNLAQKSEWFYDADDLSNLSLRVIAAEITRAKIFEFLSQEIPYESTVQTIKWDEKQGDIKIYQEIKTAKAGHKKIIIGKNAATIKRISKAAREEIERFLGAKIFLHVDVVHDAKWKEKFDPRDFS